MIADAQESLQGEAHFLSVKRQNATDVMRKQWADVLKDKQDNMTINRIF